MFKLILKSKPSNRINSKGKIDNQTCHNQIFTSKIIFVNSKNETKCMFELKLVCQIQNFCPNCNNSMYCDNFISIQLKNELVWRLVTCVSSIFSTIFIEYYINIAVTQRNCYNFFVNFKWGTYLQAKLWGGICPTIFSTIYIEYYIHILYIFVK